MITGKLSDEQRAAVVQSGHVVLTACPGSGKTRVLIHKLAFELDRIQALSRKRVAAVTFTVRASDEIYRRLSAMGIDDRKAWSGTLHAFCLEWIIRPYSCYVPALRDGFSIADESFCSDLLDELKDKHKLRAIESVNTRLRRDGSFVEQYPAHRDVLAEYHHTLRARKLIDFDLLLYYAYRLLEDHPTISTVLSNIFTLICVDEYQDTQDLLYAIICRIVKVGKGKTSLFLVGDTDQAIYASLGGLAKSLAEVQEEIGGQNLTPLTLSGNYRSCQRIIDFYRHFQTQPIDIRALGQSAANKGRITFDSQINEKDLVTEIARLINMSLDSGIPESEICVLVPQWWLITRITRQLRAQMPAVAFDASGLSPMSRNRDNIWYKLSRLFLTTPSPKIYSARNRWASELISDFISEVGGHFDERFDNPRQLLRLINSISSTETEGIDYLQDCFAQFTATLGLDYVDFPGLSENYTIFFDNVSKRLTDPVFNVPSDVESFKSFYREMTGVVINTCVGVKGEEFETVIAYGLLNGYVPHWNEIFNGDPQDASRKLLYVVCSRAKTNLHLISETGRTTRAGTPLYPNAELDALKFDFDQNEL
ncbi:UvrD-helicase domain-containing protein [Dyadobacter aurulentus]|uniref:UvrD-helicase domain-containing protein n=1 Tax=Dyadobacter sp. UC 10 TaxID=2605428 RepID=UPI0011F13424|nr:ATP-dependent helicase [Dyadobacter sp. UC 10]KAA0990900.1 ATP-dependent helicase [Dyadobacter sp. UC 10]